MRPSLILCTRNADDRLDLCLQHLAGLEPVEGLELLLVDNGSTDGRTLPRLEAFAERSTVPTRVFVETKRGNSAGRNRAIREASGDVMLFIDDDCYVEPGFARAWSDVFAREGVAYGSGRILPTEADRPMLEGPDGRKVGGYSLFRQPRRVRPREISWRVQFQGSNMAIARRGFDAVGLFDERLGSGLPFGGEDWDMALRMSFAGLDGGFFPDAAVVHDQRRRGEVLQDRRRYYIYSAGAVYAKHLPGSRNPRLWRAFLGDLRRSRADRARLQAFLAGFRDFRRVMRQR